MNKKNFCKRISTHIGFTLAETLITLAVIGIVAALTMPGLINDYKQNVFNNQFKKVYSTLSNAHVAARYQWGTNPLCYYGYGGYADNYSDCPTYSKIFLEQLKIAENCGNNAMQNRCIPEYKGWEKVKKENNPDMDDDEVNNSMKGCTNLSSESLKNYPAYILQDGTIIMPSVGDGNQRIAVNTIVDINGMKGPNKWGHDVFYFYLFFDGNKFYLENSGGCMPLEKGGRSTSQMIKYVYSH